MTYDHIPEDELRVKHPKSVADRYTKLIFPPFKHFILKDTDFIEVARSHWVNGISNGHFSQEHGKVTNRLAMMYMKLVERYSQRANWRGYTYVDEMRSQALLQLSAVGLQFDESKGNNPFAYYTVTVSNAFTRVFNLEKRAQTIRDDILIQNGVTPSMTRQLENSMEQQAIMNAHETGIPIPEPVPTLKPTRGRKPKPKIAVDVLASEDWDDSSKDLK